MSDKFKGKLLFFIMIVNIASIIILGLGMFGSWLIDDFAPSYEIKESTPCMISRNVYSEGDCYTYNKVYEDLPFYNIGSRVSIFLILSGLIGFFISFIFLLFNSDDFKKKGDE